MRPAFILKLRPTPNQKEIQAMSNSERLIVVTGATSGIGLATVSKLKEEGYNVILTGRNFDKVQATAKQLDVPAYTFDVADAQACTDIVRTIEAEHGAIWGLVNNAGIWLEGDFETHDTSDIRSVMETNTLGTMFMTHAVLPAMLNRKSGAIINVVSMGALYCRKHISVYAGSKWAIRGFTGCLEVECAPKGVRVMGFYPGKVETNMYETAGIERNLDIAMQPKQSAHMIHKMLDDDTIVWGQVAGRSINDYA